MNKRQFRREEDSEREKYWNEDYVHYWKARVDEANRSAADTSSMVKGDAKSSADTLYIDAIGLLNISGKDKVLELGCGFGRSLPVLCKLAVEVTAVDISKEMIDAAMDSCQELNVGFRVAPSEDLPFANESFDVVVCFAAFDAMYQAETLIEMNRVSRTGARVLITGKNDNYHDDDTVALEAEVGARAKKHPNYFTDCKVRMKNLAEFGFEAEIEQYYLRRGDFAKKQCRRERPEMFYEYLFVLKKAKGLGTCENLVISSKVSKTYARRNQPV